MRAENVNGIQSPLGILIFILIFNLTNAFSVLIFISDFRFGKLALSKKSWQVEVKFIRRGGDANAQRQNLSSLGVGSSPSVSCATASVVGGGSDSVSRAAYNPAVARQEANDKKFPAIADFD